GREQVPAIEFLAAGAVRQAQRLDGGGECDHGKVRHQQEGHFLRQLARLGSKHGLAPPSIAPGSPSLSTARSEKSVPSIEQIDRIVARSFSSQAAPEKAIR